jgi:magnesium chelatase subunit D
MSAAGAATTPVADADLAAVLLAIDPVGLGGILIRGGPGPSRDAWLARLKTLLAPGSPVRRAPLHIDDERLLGGLDLAASLAAGRPVAQRGVLAESDGGILIAPMAERLEAATAGRMAAVLDRGEVVLERDGFAVRRQARLAVIAFDEGIADDERAPAALAERLAFWVELPAAQAAEDEGPVQALCQAARFRLAQVVAPREEVIEALCTVAVSLGVGSLRAPLLALAAARANAALHDRTAIADEDAAVGARLVLAPRATVAPAADMSQEAPPPTPEPDTRDEAPEQDDNPPADPVDIPPSELVVEAIRAALPPGLLEGMSIDLGPRARQARGRGAGAAAKSASRGRPVGSRAGARRPGERLNIVETLRAAAPWQKLRRGADDDGGRVRVRRDDFRIRRFVQKRESTTIFVVDASGSAAVQRLAEAKGAVELLLAKAYATRARVALVAFRGAAAEILLPPTRSLTRARRRLADLPGGGGTPLAAGIDVAIRLALAERALDRTPLLVFLTDGRANIGFGGIAGRETADADALVAAARVRVEGVAAAYIDTSPRPRPGGDRFARAMEATYAPLPYLESGAVAAVVDGLRASRA